MHRGAGAETDNAFAVMARRMGSAGVVTPGRVAAH